MTLLFGKYTIHCIWTSPAELPEFKGSTIRGVFGVALKHVVCALKQNACETCLLNTRCLYAQVFEPPKPEQVKDRTKDGAVSHPFVIEPPSTRQTRFEPGESFEFNLLLFGESNQSLPYFIYAFDRMGQYGMGKRLAGSAGTFKIESVSWNGDILYTDKEKKLILPELMEHLSVSPVGIQSDDTLELTLVLKTPLRLKYKNQLKADLPFKVLVSAMLRRLSSLMEQFGCGEPALDYKGLVFRANNVRTVSSDITWIDWRRYSNRQEQSMLMGGMIGAVTFEGQIAEYLPLLRFCEKVHVGKQTSFGLGQLEITAMGRPADK